MEQKVGIYQAESQMTVRKSMSINAAGVPGVIVKAGETFDIVDVKEVGSNIYGELRTGNFVILKFGSSRPSSVFVEPFEEKDGEYVFGDAPEDVAEDDEDYQKDVYDPVDNVADLLGIKIAEALHAAEYSTIESIASLSEEQLLEIEGIGPASATKVLEAIEKMK